MMTSQDLPSERHEHLMAMRGAERIDASDVKAQVADRRWSHGRCQPKVSGLLCSGDQEPVPRSRVNCSVWVAGAGHSARPLGRHRGAVTVPARSGRRYWSSVRGSHGQFGRSLGP